MKSLAAKINRHLPISFVCVELVVLAVVLALVPWVADAQDANTGNGFVAVAAPEQFDLPAAPPTPTVSVDRTDALWSGAKTAGATIFVVALILLTTVLLKRNMPHRFGALGTKKRIHILESVGLGEKRTLTLVEIDGLNLLLASSGANVCLIKEFAATPVAASAAPVFKQELAAEMVQLEARPDFKKALGRLARIRQELEAR